MGKIHCQRITLSIVKHADLVEGEIMKSQCIASQLFLFACCWSKLRAVPRLTGDIVANTTVGCNIRELLDSQDWHECILARTIIDPGQYTSSQVWRKS